MLIDLSPRRPIKSGVTWTGWTNLALRSGGSVMPIGGKLHPNPRTVPSKTTQSVGVRMNLCPLNEFSVSIAAISSNLKHSGILECNLQLLIFRKLAEALLLKKASRPPDRLSETLPDKERQDANPTVRSAMNSGTRRDQPRFLHDSHEASNRLRDATG